MTVRGGNYVTGTSPFVQPHPPKPEALDAVAGEPYEGYDGNLAYNEKGVAILGQPDPKPVVIMINGVNLVDIITALQAG